MDEISDKINQIISRIKDIHTEKKKDITISNIAGCLRASYYRAQMGKEVSEKMVLGSRIMRSFRGISKKKWLGKDTFATMNMSSNTVK